MIIIRTEQELEAAIQDQGLKEEMESDLKNIEGTDSEIILIESQEEFESFKDECSEGESDFQDYQIRVIMKNNDDGLILYIPRKFL